MIRITGNIWTHMNYDNTYIDSYDKYFLREFKAKAVFIVKNNSNTWFAFDETQYVDSSEDLTKVFDYYFFGSHFSRFNSIKVHVPTINYSKEEPEGYWFDNGFLFRIPCNLSNKNLILVFNNEIAIYSKDNCRAFSLANKGTPCWAMLGLTTEAMINNGECTEQTTIYF